MYAETHTLTNTSAQSTYLTRIIFTHHHGMNKYSFFFNISLFVLEVHFQHLQQCHIVVTIFSIFSIFTMGAHVSKGLLSDKGRQFCYQFKKFHKTASFDR